MYALVSVKSQCRKSMTRKKEATLNTHVKGISVSIRVFASSSAHRMWRLQEEKSQLFAPTETQDCKKEAPFECLVVFVSYHAD